MQAAQGAFARIDSGVALSLVAASPAVVVTPGRCCPLLMRISRTYHRRLRPRLNSGLPRQPKSSLWRAMLCFDSRFQTASFLTRRMPVRRGHDASGLWKPGSSRTARSRHS